MQNDHCPPTPLHIMLVPPVAATEEFAARHRVWIESVVGCQMADAITFDFHLPFSHLILDDLFAGLPVDGRYVSYARALRPVVTKWQIPPHLSPNIELSLSRNREEGVAKGRFGWGPGWAGTPLAVWLKGCQHGVVHAVVPYTSLSSGGGDDRTTSLLIVNKSEMHTVLRILEAIEPPKKITMITGPDIPLSVNGYRWDSLVLSKELEEAMRRDFETFFEREEWFRRHRLPYRRGYLFYGPPGNGKTSVARVMACRPGLRALGVDFRTSGDAANIADELSQLFDLAARQAPSLVILEDIDKIGAGDPEVMQQAVNTLLSCMDGLMAQDGVIVVATVNDPKPLTNALLRRPGRFDRVTNFPVPNQELRQICLARMSGDRIHPDSVADAALLMDRFSFAQVREAYILAGQFAFDRGDDLTPDDLSRAAKQMKKDGRKVNVSVGEPVGFGPFRNGE